ncbi:MAG: hypothetical protein R2737_14885 [Candidatus Nanopelagicales bacterium]
MRRDVATLIFDDDIVLAPEARDELARTVGLLPDDWLVLYLGCQPQRALSANGLISDPLESVGVCNGSYGVLISSRARALLQERIRRLDAPFDQLLREVDEAHPGRCFVSSPKTVMPLVERSSIRQGRSQIEYVAKGLWKWSDFAGPLMELRRRRTNTSGASERVIVKVGQFNQHLWLLADLLSSLPSEAFELIWVCEWQPALAGSLRDLVRSDPRFRGAMIHGALTEDQLLVSAFPTSQPTTVFVASAENRRLFLDIEDLMYGDEPPSISRLAAKSPAITKLGFLDGPPLKTRSDGQESTSPSLLGTGTSSEAPGYRTEGLTSSVSLGRGTLVLMGAGMAFPLSDSQWRSC